MNIADLRLIVIRPTLEYLELWSQAAENLLVGTHLQEAGDGALVQIGGGPARGIYQIEPATRADVHTNFLASRLVLRLRTQTLMASHPSPDEQLATNLSYATAIARLIYYRAPDPLPGPDDIDGLAAYYKRWYNTAGGAGSAANFASLYRKHGTSP